MDGELRQILTIPELDKLSSQLDRIEAQMATKDQVEQAFADVSAGLTTIRGNLDNLDADLARIAEAAANPDMDVDAAIQTARDSLAATKAQAQALADRNPEA